MSNPWDTDPCFINHGGLNHIISTNKRLCADESYESYKNLDEHSSMKFIQSLRELAALNKEHVDASIELKRRQLYQEFYNVLSTTVLDGLISMVDFLSTHLQNIIDQKDVIIKHLQEPYVGKPMFVESKYHDDMCEFFPLIATNLADLSSILSNIEWMHKYSIRSSSLGSSLEVMNASLSQLQTQHNAISEIRDLMNERFKLKNEADG